MPITAVLEPASTIPEIGDDLLWEFIDGRIVEKPVGAREIQIANEIQAAIQAAIKQQHSGYSFVEIVFDLTELTGHKRRPDVAFVSYDRWPADRELPSGEDWKVVPNLAVEVASPANSFSSLIEKKNEYFSVGVEMVWLVVPSELEIHVYESPTDVRILNADSVLAAESILPGFSVPVAELFGIAKKHS